MPTRALCLACALIACGGGATDLVELDAAKNDRVVLESPPVIGAAEYGWSIAASPSASQRDLAAEGSSAVLLADASGTFEIVRIASDGDVTLGEARFVVEVTNSEPVAAIDVEFATTTVPGAVVGTRSKDPNGDPLEYRWEIVDGPAGASASLVTPSTSRSVFETDTAGIYEVALEVDDGDGGVARTSHRFRVHGPAFAPVAGAWFVDETPMAYSEKRCELVLGGPVGGPYLRIIDLTTGDLFSDASFVRSVTPLVTSPDGEFVWLQGGPRSVTVYRLATRTRERTRRLPDDSTGNGLDKAASNEAIYWSSADGPHVGAYFWQTDTVGQGPDLAGASSAPLVSQPMARVFVLARNYVGGDDRYQQLSLDDPPVEREAGVVNVDWQEVGGPRALFGDGRRLLTWGGAVVALSTDAPPTQVASVSSADLFAHNVSIDRLAFVGGSRTLAISDSETYDRLSSDDVTAWAEGSPLRLFPCSDGFLLLKSVDGDLHGLHVVAD